MPGRGIFIHQGSYPINCSFIFGELLWLGLNIDLHQYPASIEMISGYFFEPCGFSNFNWFGEFQFFVSPLTTWHSASISFSVIECLWVSWWRWISCSTVFSCCSTTGCSARAITSCSCCLISGCSMTSCTSSWNYSPGNFTPGIPKATYRYWLEGHCRCSIRMYIRLNSGRAGERGLKRCKLRTLYASIAVVNPVLISVTWANWSSIRSWCWRNSLLDGIFLSEVVIAAIALLTSSILRDTVADVFWIPWFEDLTARIYRV